MLNRVLAVVEKLLPFGIAAFGIAAVVLLLTGARYAHTNVEDIELALTARDVGILDSWIHLSITYDGRYSTNLLQSINPLVFDKIFWYKYTIFFNLLLLIAASYVLNTTVYKGYSKSSGFIITLTFVGVFFQLNPSLAYSLYWMGSSFVYLFSCIFFFFLSACFITYIKATEPVRKKLFVPVILLAFVSVGFSELFLPLYTISTILLPFYFLKRKKSDLPYIIPVALALGASILFMVSTPGLGLRFEKPFYSYLQSEVFKASAINYLAFIGKCVSSFSFWLLIFSTLYFSYTRQVEGSLCIKKKGRLVVAVIGMIVITYLMTLPFYLTKSYTGEIPVRVYIPVLFVQMFFLVYVLSPSVAFLYPLHIWYKPALYALVILTLAGSVYQIHTGKGSLGLLLSEYKDGKLKRFDEFMANRYSRLAASTNSSEDYKLVCVEELIDYPKSLYTHPDSEVNRHQSKWHKYMEAYFRIDEVRVWGDTTLRFVNLNR